MSVSLHQVIALTFVYGQFIKICLVPPAIVAIFPALIWGAYSFVSLCSGGHVFIALMSTAAITHLAINFVCTQFASELSRPVKFRKIMFRLRIICFVGSCLVSRRILGPLLSPLIQWNPYEQRWVQNFLSFATSVRLAAVMLILAAAVFLRYAGPGSFSKLSYI
jgi:hypothetical protein